MTSRAAVAGDIHDLVLSGSLNSLEALYPDPQIVRAVEGPVVELPLIEVAKPLDERLNRFALRQIIRPVRLQHEKAWRPVFHSCHPSTYRRARNVAVTVIRSPLRKSKNGFRNEYGLMVIVKVMLLWGNFWSLKTLALFSLLYVSWVGLSNFW